MTPLYLIGSLAGIALLVGLNLALFGRVRPRVGLAGDVAARLAREIPGFRPGACAVAADGASALIENAADRGVYFVEALGDGLVTRRLPADVSRRVARDGARLSLALGEFTLPKAVLAFDGEARAREWEARLKA